VIAPDRCLESRSLTLRGDPQACRDAATDVRALELVLTDVATDLLAHRDLDGSGRWATAYGARCRQGVDLTDELVTRCRAVVAALHDGADLLDQATVDLDETRGLAGGHGLLVGNRLVVPAPDAPRTTWDAWRRCDELVTAVRRAERAARHGLERALELPA
jgi:hypothetical protein